MVHGERLEGTSTEPLNKISNILKPPWTFVLEVYVFLCLFASSSCLLEELYETSIEPAAWFQADLKNRLLTARSRDTSGPRELKEGSLKRFFFFFLTSSFACSCSSCLMCFCFALV